MTTKKNNKNKKKSLKEKNKKPEKKEEAVSVMLPEIKSKGGRPTDYSIELADEICSMIAEGESVRQISLLDEMPEEKTIYRWLIKHEEFCQKYARAKMIQTYKFGEDIIDIADDGRNDWEERENQRTGSIYIALNEEAIGRAKIRVEARKWLMGKHNAKKYGDSLAVKAELKDTSKSVAWLDETLNKIDKNKNDKKSYN